MTAGVPTQVQLIVLQLRIVRPDVNDAGQHTAGMKAGRPHVQIQFACKCGMHHEAFGDRTNIYISHPAAAFASMLC